MLKKLLSVVALGALLSSSAFAEDILAKVSNGAISDNSAGVKVLSLDEMKEVKGGIILKEPQILIMAQALEVMLIL